MHQSTRQNLPVIAAGVLAGRSFGSIGRELGLTGRAVSLATKKWLPDVYATGRRMTTARKRAAAAPSNLEPIMFTRTDQQAAKLRSDIRADLSALIHQADALTRRLRALDGLLSRDDPAAQEIEPRTLQTDRATDRLLGRQFILEPRSAA